MPLVILRSRFSFLQTGLSAQLQSGRLAPGNIATLMHKRLADTSLPSFLPVLAKTFSCPPGIKLYFFCSPFFRSALHAC